MSPPGWKWSIKPDQLYTEYELPILAGKLILFGDVDASGCPEGRLLGKTSQSLRHAACPGCKLSAGKTASTTAILATSQESGVPPRLLKNIFAWESQFWPETIVC